jgi:hypothetical protein
MLEMRSNFRYGLALALESQRRGLKHLPGRVGASRFKPFVASVDVAPAPFAVMRIYADVPGLRALSILACARMSMCP